MEPPIGGEEAGVLVLVALRGGLPYLVLTRRSRNLGRHPGEVSFPGGMRHPEDMDLAVTAVREAREELGLEGEVRVLGGLPATSTMVTGVRMVPVVAVVEDPSFRPNEAEVDEVLEVPLEEVLRPEAFLPGEVLGISTYTFFAASNLVWGATARILKGLADAVAGSGPSGSRVGSSS